MKSGPKVEFQMAGFVEINMMQKTKSILNIWSFIEECKHKEIPCIWIDSKNEDNIFGLKTFTMKNTLQNIYRNM